jgi:predicted ABC-type ATPase
VGSPDRPKGVASKKLTRARASTQSLVPNDDAPEIIILVGANGSGKTTYYNTFLAGKGLPFINADHIAKDRFGADAEARSRDAAKIAEDTRNQLLTMRMSFCFETVFSHVSKVDFLVHARSLGYTIKMVAIYTISADLNVARVSQRVGEGGHSVPEEKIRERIPRTHRYIGEALKYCDQFVLLDNSSFDNPYVLKLAKKGGQFVVINDPLPEFFDKIYR